MREALNILGFGPTHHMFEVHDNPHQSKIWRALVEGAAPDWDQFFDGYHACVDWPSAHYWRDLIEYYPNAKVILTQRPAEAWWRSMENTILEFANAPDDPDMFFTQKLVGEIVFGGRPVKWSQKTGQLAKVYPKPMKGYENGEAPEFYRSV